MKKDSRDEFYDEYITREAVTASKKLVKEYFQYLDKETLNTRASEFMKFHNVKPKAKAISFLKLLMIVNLFSSFDENTNFTQRFNALKEEVEELKKRSKETTK